MILRLPRLALLPTLVREMVVHRRIPREPEPDLVMDDPAAVQAYAEAGRIDGAMAAYYLFHTARASLVLQGCRDVVDLGCGPATQLAQIAELNPDISFHGVDLSEEMLQDARRHVERCGISNVRFTPGDIARLSFIPDHSVDGVMGTMCLHHLPSHDHLKRCFQEIARILRPGGAVYLVDFGRLKSLYSVMSLAYLNAEHQPFLFSRDYERSLRAAFLKEEFQALAAAHLPHARVVSTFKMPVLVMVKTEDRPLAPERRAALHDLARGLASRYRGDLDDVRMFFQLDGLQNDPFEPLTREAAEALRRVADFIGTTPLPSLRVSRFTRVFILLGLFARSLFVQLRIAVRARVSDPTSPSFAAWRVKVLAETAEQFRDALGALKGPWMKFGQMASYLGGSLPEDVRRVMAPLQESSPALAPSVIRSLVEKELGAPVNELFAEWRDVPLAAASISQLHWARLPSGKAVVVKIKYPGIEKAVRADVGVLKLLAPLFGRLLSIANTRVLFDEIGRMIEEECDFEKEARFQERFRRAFENDPEIFAPKVYASYSTRSILTMDFVDGERFAEFRARASAEEKDKAATAIARAVITCFHRFGFFNADPHPGNYLFQDGRVCFLDFGFSKQWPMEFVRRSKRQSLAGWRNDVTAFESACRSLGYDVGGDRSPAFARLLQILREGTYRTWLEDEPFHFTRDFVEGETRALGEFYRDFGPVGLSPLHLPLHRVFWGHHFLFADLDARVNLHKILTPRLTQEPEDESAF